VYGALARERAATSILDPSSLMPSRTVERPRATVLQMLREPTVLPAHREVTLREAVGLRHEDIASGVILDLVTAAGVSLDVSLEALPPALAIPTWTASHLSRHLGRLTHAPATSAAAVLATVDASIATEVAAGLGTSTWRVTLTRKARAAARVRVCRPWLGASPSPVPPMKANGQTIQRSRTAASSCHPWRQTSDASASPATSGWISSGSSRSLTYCERC
jgi:hypothetical protein